VVISGNFLPADNGLTQLGNSITNSGNMTLNWAGKTTLFRVLGNVTLSGGGSIKLLESGGGIDGNFGRRTNVDNTIYGSGSLGFNSLFVTNQGVIESGAGFSLFINQFARDGFQGVNARCG
jgi:hypothetical protein